MITQIDIEQVEEVKRILNQKLMEQFDWNKEKIMNQIDCLCRLVDNLKIAPLSYKEADPSTNYYTVECKCGWWGSSEFLGGGGQIADTGDFGDCFCPVCGNKDLDDKESSCENIEKFVTDESSKIVSALLHGGCSSEQIETESLDSLCDAIIRKYDSADVKKIFKIMYFLGKSNVK